jgi:DNA-binding CsgD family transcriptional regulator
VPRRLPQLKDVLTRCQLEVADWVGLGYANEEIATRMGISLQRVKNHISEIFDCVGLVNRVELAMAVWEQGRVDCEQRLVEIAERFDDWAEHNCD